MKASDLREKSVEDLRELQASLAHDTFQNRLKNFTNRLDDTSVINKTKRDLARVITLLRERGAVASPAAAKVDLKVEAIAVATPSAVEAAPKKTPKKSAKKSEAKQS
jgi:large subunit ribosomal protein L29